MFNKLRTVIYHVKDIETAKKWYSGITGIQPYFDEPFYVGFDINGYELGLDPDFTNATAKGNQSIAYWAVDSVEKSLDDILTAGAILVQPKTNVGGDIFVAVVNDPFGNTIGLIEGA